MNMMQRITARVEVLLLAMCRTVYCWIFFISSLFMSHTVYLEILKMARLHIVERGSIVGVTSNAVYSIIWGIAWWMIFRGKPTSRHWATAANLVIIFTFVPALVSWNWRIFLILELGSWPTILFGIFGIIIFSIPYHGWRNQSPIPANCASQLNSGNLEQ